MLPEQGPPMQKLHGSLVFPQETALPTTAIAHVAVVPVIAGAESKPLAQRDFPARSGFEIPFEMKFLAAKTSGDAEYLVLAQIIDHGKVLYSNLTAPARVSFLAEPGDVTVAMRPERF